jgi:peptidoglycan hydrolase-like protein with peptidoglycan-binding domain
MIKSPDRRVQKYPGGNPMQLEKRMMLTVKAMFVISMMVVFGAPISAQDTRPRYNSAQYAEQSWTLPPDTVISVQMNGTLSSRTAHVGDKFTATVTVPVYANGRTVIPAGSIIEGRVTQVTPAKRMNRSGTIAIDFDDLVFPNGTSVGLVGSLTSDDPETRRRIDDESRVSGEGNNRASVFIGGGGAIGAVLGGIAGGGKGAVLGGVMGAGAGVASILLSKGEEAQVPAGTPFGVQIKQAMIVRESYISEGPPSGDQPPDQVPDRRQDRNERPETVGAPPDNADRTIPNRPEPENREEPGSATASAPDLPLSSPEMVSRAQAALKEQGYYEGATDGVMSPRTSGALRVYQREHNLQETGDLDPETAKRLGIVGANSVDRIPDRPRGTRSGSDRIPDRPRETRTASASSDAVMANVLSASANRTPSGAISVLINTQANTGGWRWFGEQVVNGDTLEVYARAVAPTGMATQVLTRGKIELIVKDGVEYVRRVVIHSAGGDQEIALGARTQGAVEPSTPSGRVATDRGAPSGRVAAEPGPPSSNAALSASSLQRKAEDLLSEYQRVYGVRMTGNGVEVDNAAQYREAEIELLFAIDSFANATQLYARLTASLRDRQSLRGATVAMARQARRTDRVISTTTSRSAESLATRWDSVRQDVLKLMQAHSIGSSEVED